jgi:hypothetical protein
MAFTSQTLSPGILSDVFEIYSSSKLEFQKEFVLEHDAMLKAATKCRLIEVSSRYSQIKNILSGIPEEGANTLNTPFKIEPAQLGSTFKFQKS